MILNSGEYGPNSFVYFVISYFRTFITTTDNPNLINEYL